MPCCSMPQWLPSSLTTEDLIQKGTAESSFRTLLNLYYQRGSSWLSDLIKTLSHFSTLFYFLAYTTPWHMVCLFLVSPPPQLQHIIPRKTSQTESNFFSCYNPATKTETGNCWWMKELMNEKKMNKTRRKKRKQIGKDSNKKMNNFNSKETWKIKFVTQISTGRWGKMRGKIKFLGV